MKKTTSGFTIVELLIVIVVIGILAAITIVAYNGIQNRAQNTSVQNDMVAMAKKIELQAADTGSYQPISTTTGIKINRSAFDTALNNLYYCRNTDTNQYAIAARSKPGKNYKIVNGVLDETPNKLYGADTCNLLNPAGTSVVLAWDAAAQNWASWAPNN
jgi:prepilin-type N-terminal cleavage/methylation domain-containing protein